MNFQPSAAQPTAASANTRMMRTDSPAMSTSSTPLAAIKAAVPRSGCIATRPAGTKMISARTSSDFQSGGRPRSCRYQALSMGTASFMISEGWKRMMPRLNQRCAPLPMTPAPATTNSSRMPNAYSQGARRRRKCGLACVSASMAAPPSATRKTVRTMVSVFCPEAL